ncbi:metalloprotease [Entomophthora muscae]|uniref:Metalloprotease n=1 Tax=Entomophthora muscae TaxID=34485 RepID=A0ACC2T791_9FUNG|nr:metalloprotease [Entomophthora muscae]
MILKILGLSFLLVSGERFVPRDIDGVPYRQLDINIMKSPADVREYAGLELENRLQVLLISDSKTKESGAALTVSTGSQDDPIEIPGLSNLCLHMIGRGSSKYPEPYAYRQFMEINDGSVLSTSTYDQSTFSFKVGNWALDGGLDILCQLFINPIFDKEGPLQQANIINHQFNTGKTIPSVQFLQAVLASLNSTHQYTGLLTGNFETLISGPKKQGKDIHSLVKYHYTNHYSSNLMKLVVIGKEDIVTLKRMVIPKFSSIPNRDTKETNIGSPFNAANLAQDITIATPSVLDRFIISFVLDPVKNATGLLQLEFVIHLLNSRDRGSFVDMIVSRGLAVHACGHITHVLRSFTTLNVAVYATREGHQRKQEIIELLFAYIAAIKEQGLTTERFQEFIAHSNSRSSASGSVKEQVVKLVDKLHQTQEFHSVLGYYDHVPFDRESLLSTLGQFKPSKFILYEGKAFNGTGKTEPWYGAKYTSSPFGQGLLGKLRNVTAEYFAIVLPEVKEMTSLSQPEKDEFSVSDLKMELTKRGSRAKLWSSYAKVKYDYLKVEFNFNFLPDLSLRTSMELLKDMLESFIAEAKGKHLKGDLSSSFQTNGNSIVWNLRAQQEPLLQAVAEVSKFLKRVHSNTTLIEIAKLDYLKAYESCPSYPPFRNAISHIKALQNAYGWKDSMKEATAKGMSTDDFASLFTQMIPKLKLNILAVGSFSTKGLDEIIHTLKAISTPRALQKNSLTSNLNGIGDFVYVEKSTSAAFYANVFYLHLFNADDFESYAFTYFTKMLIKNQFFYQLRTVENLGFYVDSGLFRNSLGGGISFIVQSDRTAIYLESRIEAFLQGFYRKTKATPESQLNLTLTSAAMVLAEPSSDIPGKISEFLFQIKAGTEQRNKSKSSQSFF